MNYVIPLLVALIIGVISPYISSYRTNRSLEKIEKMRAVERRRERDEDWARQDEVAKRLKNTASLVAEVAETAAKTSTETISKLDELKGGVDQVHTLVNSNLTASMRRELNAMVIALAGMKELVSVKKKLHDQPTNEVLETIQKTELEVQDLTNTLNDRMKQTLIAEDKLKR